MTPKEERELDAQVAEKVLGWKVWQSKHGYFNIELPNGEAFTSFFGVEISKFNSQTGEKLAAPGWWEDCDTLPHFSIDIAAAMEVVEAVAKRFQKEFRLGFELGDFQGIYKHSWIARFVLPGHGDKSIRKVADTAPEAICRAALAAVEQPTSGGDEDEE